MYNKPNLRLSVEAMLYRIRVGYPWRDTPDMLWQMVCNIQAIPLLVLDVHNTSFNATKVGAEKHCQLTFDILNTVKGFVDR